MKTKLFKVDITKQVVSTAYVMAKDEDEVREILSSDDAIDDARILGYGEDEGCMQIIFHGGYADIIREAEQEDYDNFGMKKPKPTQKQKETKEILDSLGVSFPVLEEVEE